MTRFVLASSPLVGPAALAPLADALRRPGLGVELPDTSADLDVHVAAVSSATPGAVLVAYSAAGPRAHLLAEAALSSSVVFLDAHLPVDGAAPDDDLRLRAFLDELPVDVDGLLPPWTDWWPGETLAALVPDPDHRRAFTAGCPRVPRLVMATPVSAPPFGGPAGYVLLSALYRAAAETAASNGWPVAEVANATHVSPFVEPAAVVDAVLTIVERLA